MHTHTHTHIFLAASHNPFPLSPSTFNNWCGLVPSPFMHTLYAHLGAPLPPFSFLLCFPLLTHPTPASPSSGSHKLQIIWCSLKGKVDVHSVYWKGVFILTHPCVGWMTLDKTFSLWGSVFIFCLWCSWKKVFGRMKVLASKFLFNSKNSFYPQSSIHLRCVIRFLGSDCVLISKYILR